MENKPKKSKALIITLIVILLIILLGFLIYKYRDMFGVKASTSIAKIFSPLLPSDNTKGIKIQAKAGEDIKQGDGVSLVNPIVMEATGGDVFGFATGDIKYNSKGEIIVTGKSANIGDWNLNPGAGEWTLDPTKGEWSFNSNSGKWIAPAGITATPTGGWVYDSLSKSWTLNPNADGGWVYSSKGGWVSPGTVPPPPSGGWVFDTSTKNWTLSPNGGEWLFNPNTGEWGSPGGDNLLGTSLKITAQAGEDIKKGTAVSLLNPTIIKATSGSSVFGIANQNISSEGTGQITVSNSGASNTFFDSFSRFLNNLFNIIPSKKTCINGAANYPMCTTDSNSLCLNGANNPPLCTTISGGTCQNGTNNPPLCTTKSDGSCLNGTTNPPLCTLTSGGSCLNGTTNPPLCTLTSGGSCLNRTTNPPLCTLTSGGSCLNGATNPDLCNTASNNLCLNGTVNPPLCTIKSDGSCLNGATNPPLCTLTSGGSCLNGTTNPPLCTLTSGGSCLNGAINPNLCTIGSDNKCLNGANNPPLCTTSLNINSTTSWTLIPNGGDWTFNPTKGEWSFNPNSGKWVAPLGIPAEPSGGWTYNSTTKSWTFDPNANGGWIYSTNKGAWVSPGTVPPPPAGGWVYDSNTKSWILSPSGGEWLFNPNTGKWDAPGNIDIVSCINGTTNPPICTVKPDGGCIGGEINPPMCTLKLDQTCSNGAIDPPVCKNGPGGCLKGETNPPLCTVINNICVGGETNPPECTVINGKCSNGATNPTKCDEFVPETNLPTVTLRASPSSVASGASSTISWTSTNSVSCDAGVGRGAGTSGTFDTGPLKDSKSYTVVCTGNNGSKSSDNVNVSVTGSGQNNKFPTVSVLATPSSIAPGESSVITWTSTNSTKCDAGVGRGTGTSGTFNTGALKDGKSYTITCTGAGGEGSGFANVFVTGFGGGNTFPTVNVLATPSSMAPGESSTITWTSTNSTKCDAGTGRGTGTSGTFNTGALKDGKSYSITCTGAGGEGSGFVNVFVTGFGGGNTFPTVNVLATPSSVASGASSTITWTSTNSKSCDAGTGRGTGTAGSFNSGTLTDSKSFSITCTGPLGSSSGFINVFVNGNGGGGGQTIFQCNDKIDNNSNGLIDELDPNCHLDGNLNKDYVPTHDSESTPPASKIADLTAGNVTPASALVNAKVTLSSDIRNIGGDSTLKDFNSFFAITRNNPSVNGSSYSTSGYSTSGYLTSGSGGSIELSVNVPMLSPNTTNVAKVPFTFNSGGTYYVRACADKKSANDSGTIQESNENNNCGAWTTFTVSSSLPPPGEICTNNAVNYPDCTVGADGKCLNGSTDPTACTNNAGKNVCKNNTINYPLCTIGADGKCVNGATDIPACKNLEITVNKCALIEQNPLTFTDAEKAQLQVLLRRFYLISSTLKTNDDISTIYNEIDQQNNFIAQTDDLVKQCYAQIPDSMMNDNQWKRHGNPWYSKDTDIGGDFAYTNDTWNGYLIDGWLSKLKLEGGDQLVIPNVEIKPDGKYNIGDIPGNNPGQDFTLMSGYYYGTGKVEAANLKGVKEIFKDDVNADFITNAEYYSTSQKFYMGGLSVYTTIDNSSFLNSTNFHETKDPNGGLSTFTYNCNILNTPDLFPGFNEHWHTGFTPAYLKHGCKFREGVTTGEAEMLLKLW